MDEQSATAAQKRLGAGKLLPLPLLSQIYSFQLRDFGQLS